MKKYNNVVEYILKEYVHLPDHIFNSENMEIYFSDKEQERKITNELSDCFSRYFNVVWQGYKNGCQWYKIIVKDSYGLEQLFNQYQ